MGTTRDGMLGQKRPGQKSFSTISEENCILLATNLTIRQTSKSWWICIYFCCSLKTYLLFSRYTMSKKKIDSRTEERMLTKRKLEKNLRCQVQVMGIVMQEKSLKL